MTKIYLVRHGETELNVKGVYYGWTDCELTEKGIRQSEELAEILKDIGFDAVIASPLKRAVDTAQIISRWDEDKITTDARLRERHFGDWEGLHFEEVRKKHKEDWEIWCKDWKNSAPTSGESFKVFYHRVRESVEEVAERYRGKTILLVSHHGSLQVIGAALLKMQDVGFWSFAFEQGKYSMFELDELGHCIIRKINCGR